MDHPGLSGWALSPMTNVLRKETVRRQNRRRRHTEEMAMGRQREAALSLGLPTPSGAGRGEERLAPMERI